MKDWIAIALVVAALIGIVSCTVRDAQRCKEKGGVYLYREYKCVSGIQEIQL